MDVPKFFDIILHPEETMKTNLKDAELKRAMKPFLWTGGLLGLFVGLGIALGGSAAGLGPLAYAAIVIVPIVLALLMAMFAGFGAALYFFISKLFGGQGTFVGNYYLSSRLFWPIISAEVIVFLLSLIPIAGFFIQIIWFFYTIYLYIILISVANNISKLKALIVYLLPGIIILMLFFLIFGSAILGLIAMMGAAGTTPKLG